MFLLIKEEKFKEFNEQLRTPTKEEKAIIFSETNSDDLTLLQFAIMNGQWAIDYLLNAGADPNIKSEKTNLTCLSLALYFDSPRVVKSLLKHGAKYYEGLLMTALIFSDNECFKLLLELVNDIEELKKVYERALNTNNAGKKIKLLGARIKMLEKVKEYLD